MRTITKKYKVYSFQELDEETKEKVLENFRGINVEFDEWYYDEMLNEIAKDYGL